MFIYDTYANRAINLDYAITLEDDDPINNNTTIVTMVDGRQFKINESIMSLVGPNCKRLRVEDK